VSITDVRRPEIDYDHHCREYAEDLTGYADRARGTARVAWSPHHGGFWVVTRAQEAQWIAQHPEIFSSGRTGAPPGHINFTIPPTPSGKDTLLLEEMDPPEHGQYRKLVNITLAPREIKQLRPDIHKWTTYLVDEFIEKGRCDLVEEFTTPAPALITVDMLGFSTDDWKNFADAFHNFAGYEFGSEEFDQARELSAWVDQQCAQMAERRKQQPADDVASRWHTYDIDGAPIASERVAMLLFHLLGGGVETTGSLTSSVLLYLHHNHRDRQRLIDEPDLLETATEEFIRCFPPAKHHARVVMEEVEVAGCTMKPGDKVLLNWIAINRDEEVFGEDSTQVVLDRFPNRHASFSYGPHRCPGSHLARESFKEMLTQVLTRLPDYVVDTDGVRIFPDQSILGGYAKMPATFTPGKRSGQSLG
jgi:cytochrome P450